MAEKGLQEEKIRAASQKVKRLKAFYKSLLFFIVVNILIIISVLVPSLNESSFFWLITIWGLFLLYQGFNYFSNFWIFSDSWDERMIKKQLHKKSKTKKK